MKIDTEIRDAVIADYKAGHSLAAIAAEHAIHRTTIYRIAKAAGLPERKRGPAKRAVVLCACGTPTTSKTRTCRLCYLTTVAPHKEPEADAELVGGAWVFDPRRRIQVWRTDFELELEAS